MPIYEYQCSACGHELEALQKMSDDTLIYCPECHAETLKKKISAAAFQLKGSGWYETDFKNSGAKPKGQETAKKASTGPSAKDKKSGSASHSSDTAGNHAT